MTEVVPERADTILRRGFQYGEDRWIVDSEAWSEEKVVGYYCSECGAEK